MEEIWKQIPEAVKYELSNFGQVRNVKTGRILKLHHIGRTPIVTLMDAGFRITRSVPKLVDQLFGPGYG